MFLDLLYEKLAHTVHGTLSALVISVPCFDALTVAHYDVTMYNGGQACDVIMDYSWTIKTRHTHHQQRRRTMYSMGQLFIKEI